VHLSLNNSVYTKPGLSY